jgi:hypothetical protein
MASVQTHNKSCHFHGSVSKVAGWLATVSTLALRPTQSSGLKRLEHDADQYSLLVQQEL